MEENLHLVWILHSQGEKHLLGEVDDIVGAVAPDLPAEHIFLVLSEGYLDVVLVLLLNVNPLEIFL